MNDDLSNDYSGFEDDSIEKLDHTKPIYQVIAENASGDTFIHKTSSDKQEVIDAFKTFVIEVSKVLGNMYSSSQYILPRISWKDSDVENMTARVEIYKDYNYIPNKREFVSRIYLPP